MKKLMLVSMCFSFLCLVSAVAYSDEPLVTTGYAKDSNFADARAFALRQAFQMCEGLTGMSGVIVIKASLIPPASIPGCVTVDGLPGKCCGVTLQFSCAADSARRSSGDSDYPLSGRR